MGLCFELVAHEGLQGFGVEGGGELAVADFLGSEEEARSVCARMAWRRG